MNFREEIFRIGNEEVFNRLAIGIFRFQAEHNPVYRDFIRILGIRLQDITTYTEIPFLPIGFFKTHKVYCGDHRPQKTFLSSGTTGMERSRHEIADISLYEESLLKGFGISFGSPSGYTILGLMPAPEGNPESSLVFMTDVLMKHGIDPGNGFFRMDFQGLEEALNKHRDNGRKVILIGLSYALLDFAATNTVSFPELIVIETGGMKGRRKEMVRDELHEWLSAGFGVRKIRSEYGMTELLSQAWSEGDGLFLTPPWMKVLVRDINDPFQLLTTGETGGINIIDLSNIYSCSFIATQDIGKVYEDGSFGVMGRFDNSDTRGCNLMVY
ncbi:MAG: acyl transferase [Bacteroidetes bacterium]|nr:acyl transferase [Bacteroidota bacterium]